jgi:hypothetical protein
MLIDIRIFNPTVSLEHRQQLDGTWLGGGCWVDRATANPFAQYELIEREQAIEEAKKGPYGWHA